MNSKAIKRQLLAAIAMVLVAALALGSSTYAWFINNTRVTATNVNVTASTAYSLLISKDTDATKTWGTTTELDTAAVNLIPASTVGTRHAADDSESSPRFSKNDLRFATDTVWNGNFVTGYKEVYKTDTVSTTKENGDTIDSKYFYKDTVYLKSSQDAKIYLDGNATGIGQKTGTDGELLTEIKFNAADLTDEQKAMLNTMRVAFVVTNETTDADTVEGIYAYQLVTDGTAGTTHYSTTANASGANGVTAGVDASLTTIAPATYSNTTNKWVNETVPVITAKMATGSNAGFATVGDGQALTEVKANDVVKVDIYVWMEGCDYDVNATNLVNFQEVAINAMMFGFCIGAPTT